MKAAKQRRTRSASPGKGRERTRCFVYVLGCRTKDRYWTYVGWTTDVDRRLAQHNAGTGARSTRGRVWTLLHVERHATRREAMSREWHLKRDRKYRKLLAEGDLHLSSPRKRGPTHQ
jgi:putative endonuclease